MHFGGTLILLYFIEMLPRTVSIYVDITLVPNLFVFQAKFCSSVLIFIPPGRGT